MPGVSCPLTDRSERVCVEMYVSEWMRKYVTVWWKLDVRSGSVGMYVWFICLCGCVYVCPDGWVKVRSRSWTIMRRSEDAVGPCSRGGCRGNATGTSIYGRFRGVSSGFFFPTEERTGCVLERGITSSGKACRCCHDDKCSDSSNNSSNNFWGCLGYWN